MPCADENGSEVDCSSPNSISQLSLRIKTCAESSSHTVNLGVMTVKCSLVPTVAVKTGCSGCQLYFANIDTGTKIAVKGVHHWAWAGSHIYFFPDCTVSEFVAAFPNPSTVTVTRADFGKAPEDNLALSYVMGVNDEQNIPDKNGLK